MLSLLLSAAVALPPLMPIDGITSGQEGQCLTVFEGDAVEPFPFTVKGVMRNFLGPGKDVVLIRLEGEKARFTGVVAGMSGSPCSIGGKLVGALAYSFATFAKEPIAGITPMNSMLDVMRLPEENRPWRIADKDADWQALREGKVLPKAPAKDAGGLEPIATPLSIGGMHPGVRQYFAPWLEAAGFEPMASGSGSPGAKPTKLVPGSAVAAVLVRGDVDIAATGTVTSVEGDQVLAFGHPFFGAGAISIPMANASIINTMASQMRSFKMSISGAVVGEVTQDRLTAIGGYIGRSAKMMPVKGIITTPTGPAPFAFEVARDHELSPRLVAMALSNSLTGRVDAGERGTVRMAATITADGQKPVTLKNVYAAERDGGLFVYPAIDVAQAFDLLWDTTFGPPPMISVDVKAEVTPEPIEEWVEAIHIDRSQTHPGESLQVAVRLRKKGGPATIERFSVPVPHAWLGEEVDIIAAGADEAERMTGQLAGSLRPDDLGDIVKWLGDRRSDGQLYLLAVRRTSGLRAGVDILASVPASIVATVSGSPSMQRRGRGLAWEERRTRPGVVSGMAPASVRVVSR
jgi:hypothetical protein